MKIDAGKLAGFLAKLPLVIAGAAAIVAGVKKADKADKVDAVLEAIPQSVALAEYGIGIDLFNDATIQSLMKAVASAEHDLLEARKALKAGVLNKNVA